MGECRPARSPRRDARHVAGARRHGNHRNCSGYRERGEPARARPSRGQLEAGSHSSPLERGTSDRRRAVVQRKTSEARRRSPRNRMSNDKPLLPIAHAAERRLVRLHVWAAIGPTTESPCIAGAAGFAAAMLRPLFWPLHHQSPVALGRGSRPRVRPAGGALVATGDHRARVALATLAPHRDASPRWRARTLRGHRERRRVRAGRPRRRDGDVRDRRARARRRVTSTSKKLFAPRAGKAAALLQAS